MIEIADLWKSFGGLPVLRGISLQVERGSIGAVIRASTPKTRALGAFSPAFTA